MARAKQLRRHPTPAEQLLWQRIRANGLGRKLKRQIPFGPYILDFAFLSARLVVEIDGESHATAAGLRSDARRDRFLAAGGFRTLRFSNRDVLGNVEGVLHVIADALDNPASA